MRSTHTATKTMAANSEKTKVAKPLEIGFRW